MLGMEVGMLRLGFEDFFPDDTYDILHASRFSRTDLAALEGLFSYSDYRASKQNQFMRYHWGILCQLAVKDGIQPSIKWQTGDIYSLSDRKDSTCRVIIVNTCSQ